MSAHPVTLNDRILAQVVTVLARRHPGKPVIANDVAPEQELREFGLDSLATVNLMLAIESEFDIFIPQADMVPQNFRSISAIAAMIANMAIAA